MDSVDAIVVGAGVVGLATAAALSRVLPTVLVVDKNRGIGEATSSRNSEVIHGGIYYPQGSLKAQCCLEGKQALYAYCEQQGIPHRRIGKLIVAQNAAEEATLETTRLLAHANGVDDVAPVSAQALKKAEPYLRASAALHSPSTGVLDVHRYMLSLLADIEANQGQFVGLTRMEHASVSDQGFTVTLRSQEENVTLRSRYLINSAGLECARVAQHIDGLSKEDIPSLYWCRGHYFAYSGKSPFSQLIYPVPEANGAGLGIHGTIDMGGQLKFGPDVEYITTPAYPVSEALKPAFVSAIQRYFPTLDTQRLHPAYSGIRPKLQGPDDAPKDFMIQCERDHQVAGLVNLFGIESPGITASLAIARRVVHALALAD